MGTAGNTETAHTTHDRTCDRSADQLGGSVAGTTGDAGSPPPAAAAGGGGGGAEGTGVPAPVVDLALKSSTREASATFLGTELTSNDGKEVLISARQNGQIGDTARCPRRDAREKERPQQGADIGSSSNSNDNGHVRSLSRADNDMGKGCCGPMGTCSQLSQDTHPH